MIHLQVPVLLKSAAGLPILQWTTLAREPTGFLEILLVIYDKRTALSPFLLIHPTGGLYFGAQGVPLILLLLLPSSTTLSYYFHWQPPAPATSWRPGGCPIQPPILPDGRLAYKNNKNNPVCSPWRLDRASQATQVVLLNNGSPPTDDGVV